MNKIAIFLISFSCIFMSSCSNENYKVSGFALYSDNLFALVSGNNSQKDGNIFAAPKHRELIDKFVRENYSKSCSAYIFYISANVKINKRDAPQTLESHGQKYVRYNIERINTIRKTGWNEINSVEKLSGFRFPRDEKWGCI